MRLSDALEGYWLDKEFQIKEGTAARYSYVFDRLYDFLGDVDVEEITSQDIKKFLRYLRTDTDLSDRSIFDYHGVLSSFWSWAEKELSIAHVIKGKVDKPKFTKRQIDPAPMEDVRKIIRACATAERKNKRKYTSRRPMAKRDKAIIIVMVDCGIRVSELCDLMVDDYNGKRLHVQRGKGDKGRFLPLGTRARRALWRYLADRQNKLPEEPLFCTRGRERMNRNNVGKMLKRLCTQAKVSHIHPHRLRHTFAIEFLRNGGNPFELRDMLGHTTLTMVTNYVALADVDLENAQQRASPADKWSL